MNTYKGNAITEAINEFFAETQLTRLSFAISAARLGIAVVPLLAGSKRGVPDWNRLGTTDAEVIERWFTYDFPNCNFGFLMGRGWVCLDLDRHEATKDGVAKLAELHPEGIDTFSVRTPNGGMHHYFRTPGRNYRRCLDGGDGIDVLGEGGYAVGPLSVLRNGAVYEPLGDWDRARDLPARLCEILHGRFTENPEDANSMVRPTRANGVHRQMGSLAISSDPLSEEERSQLCRRLAAIDPSLPYEAWYRVIFATLNVWKAKEETIACVRAWSSNSHKWDEGDFHRKIASYAPDIERQLGLSFLARTASQFPAPSEVRNLSIPEGASTHVEFLARMHLAATLRMLQDFGSVPSPEHNSALAMVSDTMVRGLFTHEDFRFALPLETGMGKTTAVVSLCSVIATRGIGKALLICCERVDQLSELRAALILAGVPSGSIGLIHNSQAYKQSVPAIPLDRCASFQFLLVCHQKVKLESVREYPERLMQYKDRRRDMVIWDESLISSSGFYVGRKEMIESIAMWEARYALSLASGKKALPSFAEVYISVSNFLFAAKGALLATTDGVVQVEPAGAPISKVEQAFRNILGDKSKDDQAHLKNLMQLAEYAQRGEVRIVRISGDYALLQFQQTIDEAFNRIVVLDASCRIRDLAHYDPKLEVQSLPIAKRYANVEIRWVPARASKSSFLGRETGETHFQSFESHLLSRMREDYRHDWPGIVFCHLENKERVTEAVERCKAASGWGVAPVYVLHWGEHRATNRYRDCQWTFFWGVQYLPTLAIAAQIIGQTGRLDYSFMAREIEDVMESEVAEGIYQASSRGASRNVISGEAGHQVIDLVLPENHGRNVLPLLEQVMPGVRIRRVEPAYFKQRPRKNALNYIELAEMKRGYLLSLPVGVTEISKRKLNKHFGVAGNDSLNRNADRYLAMSLTGWAVEGRSFVRKVE